MKVKAEKNERLGHLVDVVFCPCGREKKMYEIPYSTLKSAHEKYSYFAKALY